MRRSNTIFIGWQTAILALVVFLCGLPEPAYCQADGTVLLLQQTPPEAGTITPGVGVHSFESDIEVTLTAVAKPGYQFVYWLGDVSEPTANRTVVYLDAPKIIIAVFERSEYEFVFVQERSQNAPASSLYISGVVATQGGFGGGGGERPPKWRWPTPPEPEESEPIPVPEEGDDFPVPIPEPATVCLLGLGGLILLRRRRRGYVLK